MDQDTKEFNKKVSTVKLLLSSLFARKQQYMIVDGNHKNRFMYTNLPFERVQHYRPDIEDTVCGVTIDNVVAPLIYEAFPVLGDVIAELKMQDFLSTMNKQLAAVKTQWPELKINGEKEVLEMKLTVKNEDGTTSDKMVEVGKLLPPDAMDHYEEIINNFKNFSDKAQSVLKSIEIPKAFAGDQLIMSDISLDDKPEGSVDYKYPIKDGSTVVSFKEYVTKRNKEAPWKFNANISYIPDTLVARIAMMFRDDWVDCISIMPAAIWFPFRNFSLLH